MLVVDPAVGIGDDVDLVDVETRGDAEEDLDGTDDELPGFDVVPATFTVLGTVLIATRRS